MSQVFEGWVQEVARRESANYAAFGKVAVALAGGALAVSLTFMRDIVRTPSEGSLHLLITSWVSLCLSLLFMMAALLLARLACTRALRQHFRGNLGDDINPGGWFARIAAAFEVLAALSVVTGIGFLLWFAVANMKAPSGG